MVRRPNPLEDPQAKVRRLMTSKMTHWQISQKPGAGGSFLIGWTEEFVVEV